jgi:hypothetical protein
MFTLEANPSSLANTSTKVGFSVKMNETSDNNPQYPVSKCENRRIESRTMQ